MSEVDGDCDDDDLTVYPGAPEVDNGVDDDCDGEIDEGLGDLDGDGWTVDDGDCDDSNGWVSPSLAEMCDGVDNNCDGKIDEDEVCGPTQSTKSRPGECGCSNAPGPGVGWLGLGLVVVFGRRRFRALVAPSAHR
jgi:MYXO-CTERM domain-containing protein